MSKEGTILKENIFFRTLQGKRDSDKEVRPKCKK